jgi:thiosulfate/3-mercaptopyruvate sulfurtransferase
MDAGVTPEREVITYCGRGYAGACGLLALKLLGYERARLYDGSWAEWSADPSLPTELSSP